MIASPAGYNSLGRLGPLYPRLEYRPGPDSRPPNNPAPAEVSPLKVRLSGEKTAAKHPAALSPAKLNLARAKLLTSDICESIKKLPPQAANSGPHRFNPFWGLLGSRYI
ncbi:MAG: hypothetical protein LBK52_07535 [Deltaproteobacteria bacterium]|jgi:hypothetical protein|nr:hypothetical protein [Deltaproteobacteria bacterium]